MAEPRRINRSVYGQYGLAQIEGYEVPYLSASKAEQLAQPGEKFFDASHGRGNYLADLGWSGNSFSNALARGAAAFGVEKIPVYLSRDPESGFYNDSRFGYGILGDPTEPFEYQFRNLDEVASKFGIDRSQFQPYEIAVEGTRTVDPESGAKAEGVMIRGDSERGVPDRPLTRTVTVEEQMYDKLNELTKDYYSYTGDTLVPGKAAEGSPESFQTVLYKKEGDVLKPITTPVSHGGWQNADVYTGGGGFKLSELIRGVAPIAAFAIGAPFLDAALGASAASAAGGAGATAGAQTGNAMLASLGLGAEAALPFTAAAGLPANLFTIAPAAASAAGALSLGDDFAQLMQTYPNMSVGQLQSIAEINYGLNPTTAFDAANLAASGYNPATINQVLGYSYTPTELAGTGVQSFVPSISQIPQYPGDAQYIEQDIMEQARSTNVPSGSPTSWDTGVPSLLTPGQAIQGLRMASGLLSGGQPQPQQQPQMMGAMNRMPQGAVDYSGIYNLLGLQRPQNRLSLLG